MPSDWKALAAEKGHNTKCPWCQRFVSAEVPRGMILAACNDCRLGDVVLIGTREPAFKGAAASNMEPWPAKGTPEYEEFAADREMARGLQGAEMKAQEPILGHLLNDWKKKGL